MTNAPRTRSQATGTPQCVRGARAAGPFAPSSLSRTWTAPKLGAQGRPKSPKIRRPCEPPKTDHGRGQFFSLILKGTKNVTLPRRALFWLFGLELPHRDLCGHPAGGDHAPRLEHFSSTKAQEGSLFETC